MAGALALYLAVEHPEHVFQGQKVLLRGAQAPVSAKAVLVRHEGKPLGICEISQGALKTIRLFNL